MTTNNAYCELEKSLILHFITRGFVLSTILIDSSNFSIQICKGRDNTGIKHIQSMKFVKKVKQNFKINAKIIGEYATIVQSPFPYLLNFKKSPFN